MSGCFRFFGPRLRGVYSVPAMLGLLAVLGTVGCFGGGGEVAGPARFEPGHPPEHFRERHQRVLRDFYGNQIRVRRKRVEVMLTRQRNTDRWWMSQRRRVMARERMVMRDEAILQDFLRRQQRRQEVADADAARDAFLKADFLASQDRFEQLRQERAMRDAAFNRNLLRVQSEGRQEAEAQKARNLELLLEAQARARRLVRQPRGAPFPTAQARSAAGGGTQASGAFAGFLRQLKGGGAAPGNTAPAQPPASGAPQ